MKYDINSRKDLATAIELLEDEVEEQSRLLAGQAAVIYDGFRPVNIARELVKEVVTSDEFRSNLLTAVIGITTGYVAKKLFVRGKRNMLKKLAGNFLQYGIANVIVNPERILKSIVLPVLEFFSNPDEKESKAT
jgi:hypothetical protein